MSIINDQLRELQEALATLEPQLEGLADLDRAMVADVEQPARAKVQELTKRYTERRKRLQGAVNALNELVRDHYPDDTLKVQVPPEIYATLHSQAASISAALAQIFPLAEAVSGEVVLGTPVAHP
jgi:DnaJ-domain-containing protein 1